MGVFSEKQKTFFSMFFAKVWDQSKNCFSNLVKLQKKSHKTISSVFLSKVFDYSKDFFSNLVFSLSF